MQRREALRLLMAGGVLRAVPADLFGFFRDSHPDAGYALRTLDAHQNETVVAMIDQIIPATETPGAKGALVNEFMDVVLTEWANDEERRNFLSGLADADKQSNTLFGKNFVDASPDQQLALLRSLDEAAAVIRARSEHKTRPPQWKVEGRDLQMQDDFFTVFKRMTVHGYYTSEIGFSQELKLQIIPGAQHGCIPVAPGAGDAEG
ncbi:MAG TPA: gluconate 2-dehydrogenase subunit 3 family protein [Candidatus Udaeobacter sp.]|nr:gluconate 2-dehydrogenase subunit 3 family protein [Candidatus Udaeobacter sp.]